MRTILVDDEEWGLKRFQVECEHIEDVQLLGNFTSPRKAIEFVAGNRVELAFLDVEMPEMNGLELAGKLRELIPEIIIIFVSAYENYMPEAFRTKKADYYVMKPYSSEDIEDAVSRAKLLSGRLRKQITAETFGTFELIVDGAPVVFQDEKNKELLALLIDRNSEPISVSEICSALWDDSRDLQEGEKRLRCRRQIQKLKAELEQVRFDSAIQEENQTYYLHKGILECDYYRFLGNDAGTITGYPDRYMTGYRWAEKTREALKRRKEEFLKNAERNTLQAESKQSKEAMEQEYLRLTESCKALQKCIAILKDSEETYRTALSMTTHTVTIIDIPNRALCQIFNEGSWSGVQTTMTDAPESIIQTGIIHSEDEEKYRAFYRKIYGGSDAEECSIRTLSENGHWFWFTMYTKTIFDEDGVPKYAICFSDDLTSRCEAELMYQQLVQIITSEADDSWEYNISKDYLIRKNGQDVDRRKAGEPVSLSDMMETLLSQIIPEDREGIRDKFDRIGMLQNYYDGKRELHAEYRYRLPASGQIQWRESVTYLLMDEKEEVRAIMTARDITAQKSQEQKETSQLVNDPLCHVNRRDIFDQRVKEEIKQNPCGSLFMIDVDQFKEVNDAYGHVFGDQVLIEIAAAIKQNFRSDDFVARYGGDEFVVFMRGSFSEKVLEAAGISLLNRIRAIQHENGYQGSVSVGIAKYSQEEDLKELYSRTDDALYQAKEKGRNTFCIG